MTAPYQCIPLVPELVAVMIIPVYLEIQHYFFDPIMQIYHRFSTTKHYFIIFGATVDVDSS